MVPVQSWAGEGNPSVDSGLCVGVDAVGDVGCRCEEGCFHIPHIRIFILCLLYTSDAADE